MLLPSDAKLRPGRSPYGERGLKFTGNPSSVVASSRSPYGERGLKFQDAGRLGQDDVSLSLRRAWIEITRSSPAGRGATVALLTESVD